MGNVHSHTWIRIREMFKTHIYITSNIGIPKHKNTYDFLVQVRNYLLPLSLKVFRHKQWDSIFLCWLFYLAQTTCGTHHKAPASKRMSPFFFGRQDSTNWRFSKSPKSSARALPVHDVIHIHWSTFLSGIFILTSLNYTSSPWARQHLRSILHLTNPCTEPKGSQPN